jgi:GNAT superfamily N-acetyltransferase
MQDFDERVIANWAAHLECPAGTIQEGGTTLMPDEKAAGQGRIVLLHIGRHAFVRFDPALAGPLKAVIARLPAGASCTGDDIGRALGAGRIASHDAGPIHYLHPSDLPGLEPPRSFAVRELSPADRELLAGLHGRCTPEEVEDGYVEIDHEIVYGCVRGGELVSAASGYRMAGFLDIGVLTHPGFRRQGLGKAVVGALCQWAVDRDVIAQYRCLAGNIGSLGTARSLNFRHYYGFEILQGRQPAGEGAPQDLQGAAP